MSELADRVSALRKCETNALLALDGSTFGLSTDLLMGIAGRKLGGS